MADLGLREPSATDVMLGGSRATATSKTQAFNAVYGIFDEQAEENVMGSHVSRPRRKIRVRLGYDPIEAKRHLGCCLEDPAAAAPAGLWDDGSVGRCDGTSGMPIVA